VDHAVADLAHFLGQAAKELEGSKGNKVRNEALYDAEKVPDTFDTGRFAAWFFNERRNDMLVTAALGASPDYPCELTVTEDGATAYATVRDTGVFRVEYEGVFSPPGAVPTKARWAIQCGPESPEGTRACGVDWEGNSKPMKGSPEVSLLAASLDMACEAAKGRLDA
jgi:hypothetical protein